MGGSVTTSRHDSTADVTQKRVEEGDMLCVHTKSDVDRHGVEAGSEETNNNNNHNNTRFCMTR